MHTTFSQNKHCHYCHKSLSQTESIMGDVCNDAHCRLSWQNDKLKLEQLQLKQKLEQDLAFEEKVYINHQQFIEKAGIKNTISTIVSVVPANIYTITDIPQQRIQELRRYLEKCINDAMVLTHAQDDKCDIIFKATDSLTNTESEQERDAMIQACSTCKGFCCLGGGRRHGFQDTQNILGYMQRNSQLSPAEILTQYIERIPQQSYQDSCLYHTESGCNLPRDMRAEICNRALCKGLERMKRRLTQGTPDAVFIVAQSDYQPVRSAVAGENANAKELKNIIRNHPS